MKESRKKVLKKLSFLANQTDQEHPLSNDFSSPSQAENYFFEHGKKSTESLIRIIDTYLNGIDSLEKIIKTNFKKISARNFQIVGPKSVEQTMKDFEEYKIIENEYHLWYDNHVRMVNETLELMNDEKAKKLFASILASTSVSISPTRNIKVAMEFLEKFVESGSYQSFSEKFMKTLTQKPPEDIREDQGKRTKWKINELTNAGFGSSVFEPGRPFMGHMYGASVNPNVLRSFRGEEISGPKVGPYSKNLMGDQDEITVDIHVARYLLGIESPKKDSDYTNAKDLVREIAAKAGITNAQAQAGVWCANLILTGEPIDSYDTIITQKKEKLKNLLVQARQIIS